MRPSAQDVRPKAKILCVEDDVNLQKSITFILWREGYKVLCAQNGEDALELARREKPDLILLDLILPGIDGSKLCSILKKDPCTADILVVMLTAKKQVQEIVAGLKSYADDYIIKPFEPEILLARLQALLRRKVKSEEKDTTAQEIDDLLINRKAYEVLLGGKKIHLSKTEFEILSLLANKPNQVFTRSSILDHVREDGYPITERIIDYHITGLRKKLGKARKFIRTVRGVGYKFEAEESS
jgi:two-component system, OmpR family, alkaline phosphatase synthesis response regulator PhoP